MILSTGGYGPLAGIVSGAAAAISAAGAIGLTWRGRAKWEPAEPDLPKAPEKVGGLLGAVAVVLIWLVDQRTTGIGWITVLAILAAAMTVVALLVYVYLISVQTFERVTGPSDRESHKIVGGFWLTDAGREAIRDHRLPVQEVLKGMAYNPEYLWPRSSRALAKVAFIVNYLALTVCGTIALAATGALVAHAIQQ